MPVTEESKRSLTVGVPPTMSQSPVKLCKTCRWRRTAYSSAYWDVPCVNPNLHTGRIEPVLGGPEQITCFAAIARNTVDLCGPTGRWHETIEQFLASDSKITAALIRKPPIKKITIDDL